MRVNHFVRKFKELSFLQYLRQYRILNFRDRIGGNHLWRLELKVYGFKRKTLIESPVLLTTAVYTTLNLLERRA